MCNCRSDRFVDIKGGRVEKYCIRGADKRCRGAPGIAGIARQDIGKDTLQRRFHPPRDQFRIAPPGPGLGRGSDKQFDLGPGADDGPDVAPVQYRPAIASGKRTLKLCQRSADIRDGGNLAGHFGRGCTAQAVITQCCRFKDARGMDRIITGKNPGPDGPIKQSGVQMGKAEMRGNRLGDRAFARCGRPVDGDCELQ